MQIRSETNQMNLYEWVIESFNHEIHLKHSFWKEKSDCFYKWVTESFTQRICSKCWFIQEQNKLLNVSQFACYIPEILFWIYWKYYLGQIVCKSLWAV